MRELARRRGGGWGGSVRHSVGQWPEEPTPSITQPTQNLNVIRTRTLVYPRHIKRDLPMTVAANRTIVESREAIKGILAGRDPRLLVVVGPCSLHDDDAAREYADRLAVLAHDLADRMLIIMRVYFEKPRTTIGWKGLINDPHLDGSFDMETGIRRARKILLYVSELGLGTGTEMLDPIIPQYTADLVSWGAIGARTTESQTHRQMASGLSMPVGLKNGTDGSLQVALDALAASRHSHSFLGIDENGMTAVIDTRGNPWGHIILRGGRSGPNYDAAHVAEAVAALRAAGLPEAVMVDCSHANADKKYQNQHKVWWSVIEQRLAGSPHLIGAMLESHLFPGSQKLDGDRTKLQHGVSITDECIGWEETERLLREGHRRLAL